MTTKRLRAFGFTNFGFLLLLLSCSGQKISTPSECEIGIVGGGPAGMYMAYRLAPHFGQKICLFEKQNELGGRMRDEQVPGLREPIFIGTGARRVNATQKFVLNLGLELGISFENPEAKPQLIQYRGKRVAASGDLRAHFRNLPSYCRGKEGGACEDLIYARLLAESEKSQKFPLFKNYIAAVAGKDAWAFLRASSRFHGDFDYEISTANYLAYLKHELSLSSTNLYPVGGMSAFIRAMRQKSKDVQFFLGEPVESIVAEANGYRLQTSARELVVKRLVLAVPPIGMDKIQGTLAESIRDTREFKSLLPVSIVVINQVWNEPWWDSSTPWRAWSSDHCVTHTEIPQENYVKEARVTRSVYTDNLKCVRYWQKVAKEEGIAGVEDKVVANLKSLFGKSIPKPKQTTMHHWPAGWYYVRAGSKVSNEEIMSWSLQPLKAHPDLMLVGEAYWPDRPGWSEGAYFSAQKLLREKFGLVTPQ